MTSHLLSLCFGLSVYWSNIALSFLFLPPTLLMWVFSCVSLSHLLEFILSQNVSLQGCTDFHTLLPTEHLRQSYWLTPHYIEFSLPYSSLYKLCIGTTGFLMDSWPLEIEPIGCPETSLQITTTCCVITQKSAVLVYFAVEAWNQPHKLFPMSSGCFTNSLFRSIFGFSHHHLCWWTLSSSSYRANFNFFSGVRRWNCELPCLHAITIMLIVVSSVVLAMTIFSCA
jgi:hypothetical protein